MKTQKISRTKLTIINSTCFLSLVVVNNVFGFRWALLLCGVITICLYLYYRTKELPWRSKISPRAQLALVFVVSLTTFSVAAYYWSRPDPIIQRKIDARIDTLVSKMADLYQPKLPMKMDEKSTLVSVKANKRDLYLYHRTDVPEDGADEWNRIFKVGVAKSYCEDKNARMLLDAGMIWHYINIAADGRELFEIKIAKEDCLS